MKNHQPTKSPKLVATNLYARFFRRVSPAHGKPIHEAAILAGIVDSKTELVSGPDANFNDHAGWPESSIDGYFFTDADAKVVTYVKLYRNENGELVTIRATPNVPIVTNDCKHHCKCGQHK